MKPADDIKENETRGKAVVVVVVSRFNKRTKFRGNEKLSFNDSSPFRVADITLIAKRIELILILFLIIFKLLYSLYLSNVYINITLAYETLDKIIGKRWIKRHEI